jgi:hypothetical protein
VRYVRRTWRIRNLRRLAAVALPVLVAAATGLGGATGPAYAGVRAAAHPHHSRVVVPDQGTPDQYCAQGGAGYCLNDWNGTIGDVMMYNNGYKNNGFYYEQLGLCPGNAVGDRPGDYCPFSNHALDQDFFNDYIFQLESAVNPGWCIGTSASSSLTILQPCNSISTGTGGGDGTVFLASLMNCYWGNRYWSNHYSTPEYLLSGGAIGKQANADYSGGSPSCWGGGGDI